MSNRELARDIMDRAIADAYENTVEPYEDAIKAVVAPIIEAALEMRMAAGEARISGDVGGLRRAIAAFDKAIGDA